MTTDTLAKLAAEFNRYFTSANGVDVGPRVSVLTDEWRDLLTCLHSHIDAQAVRLDAAERDKARLDWLETQAVPYGFQDIHEGNGWEVFGAYATVREAIDSERAAIASEAKT